MCLAWLSQMDASVLFDNGAIDTRQALTGAISDPFGCEKRFKNVRTDSFWNSGIGITRPRFDLPALAVRAYGYCALAARLCLYGVANSADSAGSRSSFMSPTYFHSSRVTVTVVSIAALRSPGDFSLLPGRANSFIARTISLMRSMPSRLAPTALGISFKRYSKSLV
jgi:hypothetical protein